MADGRIYEPLLDVERVVEILNKISIFAGLNENQLYKLFGQLQKIRYKKGEFVFREGQIPSHIYIIQTGKIKLVEEDDGTFFELVQFEQGDCFGESSLIGIMPHMASAQAIENTELIVLSRNGLMEIYETDKELFSVLILNIAREVCRRLHKTDNTLLHYIRGY